MCGILGGAGGGKPFSNEQISEKLALLFHRGPDEEGLWKESKAYLGIRRLAILDVANGQQPNFSEDESIVSVFNGEIYNYKSLFELLTAKGHRFRSNSDSEVIPHLYEEFGPEFAKQLDGMFAIALWDKRSDTLFLYRDNVGEKPLWYSLKNGAIDFASEVKVLIPNMNDLIVDLNSLSNYLLLGYFPTPTSPFRNISALEPGSYLAWKSGSIKIQRFWSAQDVEVVQEELDFHQALERLDQLLQESVRLRLNSERSIGVLLSGGIDSSLVAYYASQLSNEKVMTFSLGFEDAKYSEAPFARSIANYLNSEHHELIYRPDTNFVFEKLVKLIDIPFADSSFWPTFEICNFASRRVTVLLSGDGGDEIFAGYDRFKIALLLNKFKNLIPPLEFLNNRVMFKDRRRQKLLRTLSGDNFTHKYMQMNFMMSPDFLLKLVRADFAPYFASGIMELLSFEFLESDLLRSLQVWEIQNYLPGDLLYKMDMASMANSVEVRAPLLNKDIVEFGLRLDRFWKIKRKTSKYLLRELAYRKIPRHLLDRPKRGFAIPKADWLRGPLYDQTSDVLLDKDAWINELFNRNELEGILKLHKDGWDLDDVIWPILVLELWAKEMKLS